jgi:phosphate-selective porin OprO and OprP
MKTRSYFLLFALTVFSSGISAAENFPTVDWGGRVQADATTFDSDKFSYDDGTELRRGRLYVRGNLSEDWEYRMQYDFAPDDPELKDGYVRYNGFENTRITIGNFKQFSGLEELTSSNNITFIERATPNALFTGRRVGVGVQRWSDRISVAVSTYTHEANNLVRGSGVASRFVYRPEFGDTLVHLGINVAKEDDDDDVVRLRARPESHQDDHRIVNTGKIPGVDTYKKLGFEAAVVRGRFSAQSEYVRQNLERSLGPDLNFDGYYAYASYFLTNDSRPYSNTDAGFGTVTPSNASGAWELAARVSHLDLNNIDIAGGSVDAITLGVNYYMNRNLRFAANYVMADSDIEAGDDDPNSFIFRIRWTF